MGNQDDGDVRYDQHQVIIRAKITNSDVIEWVTGDTITFASLFI